MATDTGRSVSVMSSTVPWLMPPGRCRPSTTKPAMAVDTVPRVVAMPSQARKVRSLAD